MKHGTQHALGLALGIVILNVALSGCGSAVSESLATNNIVQANDDAFTTPRNQSGISPYVFANDVTSQQTAVGLRVSSFTQGARGSVSYNRDGTFTYTPDQNKDAGQDSFTYTVTDEGGGTKSATVRVTTTAAWDMPLSFGKEYINKKQIFTFANGGILALWSHSTYIYSINANVYSIWMREYRPNSGWTDNKPIVKTVLDWQADQARSTGDVFLVTMNPKPNASNPLAVVATLNGMHYSASEGWDKVSAAADADIASTAISGDTLERSTLTNQYPQFLINAQAAGGGAVVVWQQPQQPVATPSYFELYTNSYSPNTTPHWGAQSKSIDKSPKTASEHDSRIMQLLADSTGRITVIWQIAELAPTTTSYQPYLWANGRNAAGGWGTAVRVDPAPVATDGYAQYTQATMDSAGNVIVAWVRRDNANIARVSANKLSWVSTTTLAAGSPATIQQDTVACCAPPSLQSYNLFLGGDGVGNIVLAWANYVAAPNINDTATTVNVPEIYASRLAANMPTWEPARRLDAPPVAGDGYSYIKGVVRNANDSVSVIWSKDYYPQTGTAQKPRKFWAQRFLSGKDTTAPVWLHQGAPYTDDLRLVQDSNNDTQLFMLKKSSNNYIGRDLHNLRLTNDWVGWTAGGTTLPATQQISAISNNLDVMFQQAVVDKQNNITAIWSQNDGYYNHMYASRSNAATPDAWNVPQQLDGAQDWSSFTTPGAASALVDANGNITVAWTILNGGQTHLVARQISATGTLLANSARIVSLAENQYLNFPREAVVSASGMPVFFYDISNRTSFSSLH
ncbi:MAG: Ig-like domain-containing protein [Pseudomonadota bacterium]